MARHEQDFEGAEPISLEEIEKGLGAFKGRIEKDADLVRFLSGEKVKGRLSGAFADLARLTTDKDS